jgi:nucleoid-associated protein YgaU
MGLIDFVKEAGEALLEKVGGSAEAQSEAVSKRISDLGLSVEGLKVQVDGGKAVLTGKAASQAEKEKAVLAAGNTVGIGQVEDQVEVEGPEPEPESQYYRVKSGDTLSKIAKEYYGNANKYPTLFEANRPMLKDPDSIYPGQVLRIPPLGD